MPFVALFGLTFNIGILSIALGALNTVLFSNVLQKLDLTTRRNRLWLTALFGLGTVHFYLASVGYSWFLAQLLGTFSLLLALLLLFGTERGTGCRSSVAQSRPTRKWADRWTCLLIGLFFGFAVTCRLSLLAAGVFFPLFLLRSRSGWRGIIPLAAGALVPGVLYMLYNYLRFGTIMDLGYQLFYRIDSPVGGPTGLRYIPFNLYSLFVMAPEWIGKFPYIEPPAMLGVSLTFSSPALYYAFKARGPNWLTRLLWLTVILAALPFLMNCTNGFPQFGMRYALDFIPFLMILVAYALRDMTFLNRVVIMLCIWLNSWGILHWNFFR